MDFADDMDPFAPPQAETPADPRRIGTAIQLAFTRCFPGLLGAFLIVMFVNVLALIIVPASPRYSAGLKMLCFRGLCRFVAGRDGSFM